MDTEPSAAPAGPSWDGLPGSVQRRILGWAAEVLGTGAPTRVPPALRPVARFTPAKRARLGAATLTLALRQDDAFRSLVAGHVRTRAAGSDTEDDPVSAAAVAFLLGTPDAVDLADAAGTVDETARLRSTVAHLQGRLSRAEGQIDRIGIDRISTAPAGTGADSQDAAVADKLRGRLREQGTQLRELREELARGQAARDIAGAAAAAELAAVREELRVMTDRADAARVRGNRAEELLRAERDTADERQAVVSRRTELLLDTLRDAAAGLRNELRPTGRGIEPAEAAMMGLPTRSRPGARAVDGRLLTAWLGLPQAHLVVDGYNVTKTGYGDLTLADQRDRLVKDLAALASRTGAEVTVVFDGAAVVGHQPLGRGVRVLFSPPGVIADDVIRRLVAAEPLGRVVVVATSDREIVDSVAARGARTVPSVVLLGLRGP